MSFRIIHLFVGFALLLGSTTQWASQDKKTDDKKKKTDADTVVKEGTEVSLTPVEVKLAEKPDKEGRYTAKVTAKEATKVKMPAEAWALGFHPKAEAVKGGGVAVAGVPEDSPLTKMRTDPKFEAEPKWQADPGDVITHVNGYAVNTVEELVVALTTAKDKADVQLIIKDITTGELTAFYVSATKR